MGVINLKWGYLLILAIDATAGLACSNDDDPKVVNEADKTRLLNFQYFKSNFEKINATHYRFCQRNPPLQKCCKEGEAYDGTVCAPFTKKLSVTIYESNLRIKSFHSAEFITNRNFCSDGSLATASGNDRSFHLLEDGILYLKKGNDHQSYPRDSYCVDNLIRKDQSYVGTVACYRPRKNGLNCNVNLTVLAEGKVNGNGDLVLSDHTYPPGYYLQINATTFKVCVCSVRQCLRKCCPVGQSYVGRTCGTSNNDFSTNVYDSALNVKTTHPGQLFYIINGETCPSGKYPLYPEDNPTDVNYLLDNGVLYMPDSDKNLTYTEFCFENIGDGPNTPFVCFPDQNIVKEAQIYPIGFLISLPFLIVTLLVYALLPELRSLHGKNLMCHISSLIVAYLFLSIVQLLGKNIEITFCKASAYIIQFSFLATFFWLNVMSFDIWLAFSNFRPSSGRGSGKYTFLIYSAYAWGSPLIMLIVSMAIDLSPNIPSSIIKPGFGENKCWFASQTSNLAYFYGPIAVILLCNCYLFASTAIQIFVVKKETKVLSAADSRRSNVDNKQRFSMYLKLFLIMGVNWITEVISWAVGGPKEIWYIPDICNTLQGVFIFLICVGKKKIWRKLKAKFISTPRDDNTQTSTISMSRASRNSSMVMSNLENTQRKISANSQSAKNSASIK